MMASTVADVLQTIISKWVMAMLLQRGLVKAETAANVQAEAAHAGASGTASMAGAPFPLNLTAPAFGASMFAAALAYGAVPSAEGGWDVPASAGRGLDGRGGMGAIIHPREMVLPADIADGLRSGGGGGPIAVHFHGPTTKAQMKSFFLDHSSAVGSALRHYVRQGGNISPNR